MNLEPNQNRIVVKREEYVPNNTSKGGIVMPEGSSTTKQKSFTGKVVAVPKDPYEEYTSVPAEYAKDAKDAKNTICCGTSIDKRFSVGDIVVFDKNAGIEISHENEDYLVLHFDDVLVKIKTEKK